MKRTLLLLAIIASLTVKAQVSRVSLQASGLTCSMCSNAINKALKTLDFVLQVEADIKTYTFEISFKPNTVIDFDLIKKKVEGAGFAVSAFYATVHFNNIMANGAGPVVIQDKTFLFVNIKDQLLNGVKRVQILDKGFVSAKEYKRHHYITLPAKTYHVSL